jgi:hypothetical protein
LRLAGAETPDTVVAGAAPSSVAATDTVAKGKKKCQRKKRCKKRR